MQQQAAAVGCLRGRRVRPAEADDIDVWRQPAGVKQRRGEALRKEPAAQRDRLGASGAAIGRPDARRSCFALAVPRRATRARSVCPWALSCGSPAARVPSVGVGGFCSAARSGVTAAATASETTSDKLKRRRSGDIRPRRRLQREHAALIRPPSARGTVDLSEPWAHLPCACRWTASAAERRLTLSVGFCRVVVGTP